MKKNKNKKINPQTKFYVASKAVIPPTTTAIYIYIYFKKKGGGVKGNGTHFAPRNVNCR